jgi:hypothetical protein
MFLGSRARQVRRADNLTAVCDPIVQILNISQPYRPPRPITGIAFLSENFTFYLFMHT